MTLNILKRPFPYYQSKNYKTYVLFLAFSLLSIGFLVLHSMLTFSLDMWNNATISLIIALFILGNLTLTYWSKSLVFSVYFFIFISLVGFLAISYTTGGIYSPNISWMVIPSIAAFLLLNHKMVWTWLGLFVAGLLILVFIEEPNEWIWDAEKHKMNLYYYHFTFISFAIYIIIIFYLKEKNVVWTVYKYRNENEYLKMQLQVLDKRNHHLLQLYQNMQADQEEHIVKTEILKDATRLMDSKNLQIQRAKKEFVAQRRELEDINENITNSIRYAQKIQESIMPAQEKIVQSFRDAFIFFRPKDIVSGDFYWFAEKNTPQGRVKILVAADCTGHGVPGAFMTIMGNTFLNEIVDVRGITEPEDILTELDRKILQILSKENGEVQIHDGMDLALLAIHEEEQKVYYAAAHNPLYYVRDNVLQKVKGSRFPVGSAQYKEKKEFKVHEIQAKEGDVFYIFTDGFQDQFGEKAQRKYMTRRFRGFLESINRLPLGLQGKKLAAEFDSWKGRVEQTDDTLVIGFRV